MSTDLKSTKKFFVKIKRKKPDADSCQKQALKKITKAVKLAKSCVIQKLHRQVKLLEDDVPKKAILIEKLAKIKKCSHLDFGNILCRKVFEEDNVDSESEITLTEIVNHKIVLDAISTWKMKKESVNKELNKMLKKKLKKKKVSKQHTSQPIQREKKQYKSGNFVNGFVVHLITNYLIELIYSYIFRGHPKNRPFYLHVQR